MYIRRLTRALPATLTLALLWPASALAAPPNADLDNDKVTEGLERRIEGLPDDSRLRLIVSLDRAATSDRVRALEREVGDLAVRDRFGVVDAVALTATKEQVRELADQGVVERVEEDLPVSGQEDTPTRARNDSAQASFGVLEARLDAPLLDGNADGDTSTYSSADLVAAVIDSGIDASHVDLNSGKVLAFKDFVNDPDPEDADDPLPYDDDGHGTHVAATIAGDGEADFRFRGVAPDAALVGVKVLDSQGDGFTSDVVAGIEWVVANKDAYGIEAINLSLGTEGCGDGFGADSQAVNEAHAAGLAVIVAAGNDGPATCTIGSPGDAKDALTVGAMADLGADGFKQADFSSRGPTADDRIKPDISAPGVGITSAAAGTAGGYLSMNGTSMAAPFVTGVALLMMDATPAYTNDDVKDAVTSTAVDWGRGDTNTTPATTGPDIDYGAGRLDAYAALGAAVAAGSGPPLDSPPTVPGHTLREGSLGGTGQLLEYTIDIADTGFPVAATLIDAPGGCGNPDFDMRLTASNGTVVASATSSQRQDELGYRAAAPGVYKLRVYSFSGCGDFFVDVSGGAVSSNGSSDPDDDKDDGGDGTTPPPPPPPPADDPPVATAALVNAARVTASRATTRLKRTGLRRLLRRGRFTFVGLAPSAGRLELAVRMSVSGRRVVVARTVRRVGTAGQPRLTVKLTRRGRRLLRAHTGAVRLSIRAAVTDSAGRRRFADRQARVRR